MLPMPIDTTWLINREHYGPEQARKMRENAWERQWGVSDTVKAPAERNAWLIEAGNRPSIIEAVASVLSRFRRLGTPGPAAQQP